MRLFTIIFLIFSFGFHSFGQTKNINKKILLEDYDIFQSIFEEVNAGLYKYHSKKQIDSAFRSEEHTSELQSRENLVCRLLLEKKKKKKKINILIKNNKK